ncbi:hypothetical protein [Salimicrobium halophilum]|uniref:Uncharacterized protein n=1 Tax=Salimicrobium halophilum TaxID=86666 RepID=A0A1G8TS51_9BACI|nr:hypothetical protein [Salimicrobium halophilum]SDJ44263.1 hypothetical protein SAMN04490247_1933 [Salimicrobium halophilum]
MLKKLGTWIGTIAGVALGSFMYAIEKIFGLSVYTLLLNVDFIPGLRHAMGNPALEWLLHLIVSWVIGILFVYVLHHWNKQTSPFRYVLSGILSLGAASTYVPLTILAIQPTPSITDKEAVSYWLIGHGIYAYVLVWSYDLLLGKKHSSYFGLAPA